MPDERADRLCVLIDADNMPAKFARAIFDEIAGLGEASVRRIYGDWSSVRLKGWAEKVAELGMVADQQFANTTGKNASDIGLVISAMDFLHTGRFDGFVLVSSDSDFTRLAARIREQGVDVYGIGEKKTPDAFRRACKRFIFVENLGNGAEQREAADVEDRRPDREAQPALKGLGPKDAIPLVVAAMRAIGGEDEWYTLGQLGQFIVQANPDFDTRSYGSAKLSDLLRKTGRFEVKQEKGKHLAVRDLA